MTYPFMDRSNERTLPAGYAGDVLVWDIDKTYLDTRFSSFRGLLRIPFEHAIDKRAVPGTVPLLRALRRGPGDKSAFTPLYFVSGSPPQLRDTIERKMTLDGVQFDGITFKDQWGLLKARRPRAIKEQVGYKLIALLSYRRELPAGVSFVCFGDDVERDAQVFTLFGRVCAGMEQAALESALAGYGVDDVEAAEVMKLAEDLVGVEADDPVARVFIHLSNRTDPARLPDGAVGTWSFLQTALVCAADGRIAPADVKAVAEDLRRQRLSEDEIESDLEDARVRLGISAELLEWAR